MKRWVLLSTTMFFVHAISCAQATGYADISANIIHPVILSNISSMTFVSLNNKKERFKEVFFSGSGNRLNTIRIPMIQCLEPATRAVFKIEDNSGDLFEVTLSRQLSLSKEFGTDRLEGVTILHKENVSPLIGSQAKTFEVDTRLYSDHMAAPGTYSTKEFYVTVHYN